MRPGGMGEPKTRHWRLYSTNSTLRVLAEIKGDQWPIAIAYLIDARTNTNRRVYDPIGKGQ